MAKMRQWEEKSPKKTYITINSEGEPMAKNATTLPKSEWKELPEWIPLRDIVMVTDPQHRSPLSKTILEPDNANKGRYEKATVHAIGPDVKKVQVGDVVFLPEIKGCSYKEPDTGRIFLFYPEEELLAKEAT